MSEPNVVHVQKRGSHSIHRRVGSRRTTDERREGGSHSLRVRRLQCSLLFISASASGAGDGDGGRRPTHLPARRRLPRVAPSVRADAQHGSATRRPSADAMTFCGRVDSMYSTVLGIVLQNTDYSRHRNTASSSTALWFIHTAQQVQDARCSHTADAVTHIARAPVLGAAA